jgi:hypothetical protein
VVLTNDLFQVEQSIAALATGGATLMQFTIPLAQPADFPVGAYRVGAQVVRPSEVVPRQTNRLALVLAPEITGLPMNVVRDGAETATFNVNFRPALRAGQTVTLVLGTQEFTPQAFVPPTTTLSFVIPHAPLGSHLARLRVDGIDSPIIDASADPPVFLNQRITIT